MSKYKNLLASITESSEIEPLSLNDRVVLIDSMNMFIRSFSIINKVNSQGNHIGGMTGYLRSLGAMIKQIQPTRVLLIFDGEGNITNKKNLYADYKGTRKIKRITNWSTFDSLEEESESMQNQMVRLIDYLKCLPVSISIISKLEADDVIAYLAPKFKQSIIVSADQDFLQMVSDNITVYSPIKKKYYTPELVMNEFGLPPHNFLQKKVILGDTSDNVPKVPKIGEKKIFKLFPELRGDKIVTLDEIIQKSLDLNESDPLYGNIYNFKHQLKINEKLMDLSKPNIPEPDIIKLNKLVESKPQKFNKTKFLEFYQTDKLENSIQNLNMWLSTVFEPLNNFNNEK